MGPKRPAQTPTLSFEQGRPFVRQRTDLLRLVCSLQMVPSAAPAAPPAAVPGPGAWELGELQEQAQQHEQMMKQYFASQAQAEALRKFWTDQLAEAQAHRESLGDFKNQQLPLARIKKVGCPPDGHRQEKEGSGHTRAAGRSA